MNKVREYISLMQSLNIDAGYDEEFLWETIYDGLKPKLKEMWATIVSPPRRPAGEVHNVSEPCAPNSRLFYQTPHKFTAKWDYFPKIGKNTGLFSKIKKNG